MLFIFKPEQYSRPLSDAYQHQVNIVHIYKGKTAQIVKAEKFKRLFCIGFNITNYIISFLYGDIRTYTGPQC